MSNLIQLFTPGHHNRNGRFRIALGEDAVIYGTADIASISFHHSGHRLEVEHMAVGKARQRLPVMPGEEIQLLVGGKRLLLWVQAITATHVVVDAAEEPGADFALVVMPATA
ncbi:hypothetical protein HA051_08100 [Chromobacterium vaccinii]|uniref:hypothetical protein n=1 Tax=Chromobacterium violaceum TaxID=536 RepID=UPI00140C9764|nr:hypothetical protein [Chromobacterium violaceum]MBA8735362.1 hypothetical protein [Chromobacterium violaceum]NHQ81534.1 hypothetical protein [Chromobacterium vaccinii]